MRKMKRLKWVCGKEVRIEKLNQARPPNSGFQQCRVSAHVWKPSWNTRYQKFWFCQVRNRLELEMFHETVPRIWKTKQTLIMVWIQAYYMPIIQLCLGWVGELYKAKCQKQWGEMVQKNSLHVLPSLSQSIPGPTFHLEELQGTRQHQVQTRICSELARGWKIERVRLQVPFYNHSAMKSSVNKVQTSQHSINSLSGLTPAYPSITVPCHTSTLPLAC